MLSIADHLRHVRRALAVHPASTSSKGSERQRGARAFTPHQAALVYSLKLSCLHASYAVVKQKVAYYTGTYPDAIRRIWNGQAHRNASQAASELSRDDILEFAKRCQLTEEQIALILPS